jgi:type II secretory pathway pseudopilin PulG
MRTYSSKRQAKPPWRNAKPPRRRGFTLVEAALTTMILGLGTVAMMGLLATGTNANVQAANLTTAINLATDIHELADRLPFPASSNSWWGIPSGQNINNLMSAGDVAWLNGQSFSPPIDATDSAINSLSNWTQTISVTSVSSANLTSILTNGAGNPMALVTVTVNYQGQPVYQTSWLVTR